MSNILKKFEQDQIDRLAKDKATPEFRAGDTVRVNVKIIEGKTERIQAFEGVCIAIKNRGLNSSFVVRKISHGEGVERVFPLYSPRISSIEIVRRGIVRRAKLYYMRKLQGKAARIKEKIDLTKSKKNSKPSKQEEPKAKEEKPAEKKAEASKKESSSEDKK